MREKFYISLVIGALIVGVYYYISPSPPAVQSNEAIKKDIAEMELKVAASKNRTAESSKPDDAGVELESLKQEMRQITALFPIDAEMPKVLRQLATLGDTCGLQFLLFEPQKTKNEGLYEEIPVKLKLRGTFTQIASFFDGVSRLDRLIAFEDVKITGPVNNTGAIITETEATMLTYRLLGDM